MRRSIAIPILVVTVVAVGATAHAQPEEIDSETAVNVLQRWIALHEELRRHIDRSQFDLDDAIDEAGYEAEPLIQLVKDEIQFQQYSGVMRGARGTLASQAGNALDQAMLLATLLKDSGYEARIVRATLDEPTARALLAQVKFRPEPDPPFKPSAHTVMVELGELASRYGERPASLSDSAELALTDRKQEADSLATRLVAALDEHDLSLATGEIPKEVVDEARDYFWVRYRIGASEPWVDVHPAFATTPQTLEGLEPVETFADEIPEDLLQRFGVRGFVKRRLGSREETQELFQAWNRPVANLLEEPIVYSHFSPKLAAGSQGTEGDRAALFLPMLGDSPAPSAQAFDLNGNVVPMDAAMSSYAGVFATMSDKTISAVSALSELGSNGEKRSQPAMALEDVWLEFTLQVPGKDDRTWKRSFRSVQESQAVTAESLARRVVVSLQPGPLAPAKRFDRALAFYVDALKLALKQHQAMREDSLQSFARTGHQTDAGGAPILENNLLFDLLTHYLDAPGEFSYRHEPMIVADHISILSGGNEPNGLDIMHNARRSFTEVASGNILRFSPAITLRKGVWEAMSEATIMSVLGDNPVNAIQASRTMLGGRKPIVITRQNLEELRDQIPEALSLEIVATVERGNVAIIPPRAAEVGQRAWWSIDPTTGQTLGLTDNGWGGSYLIVAAQVEDLVTRKIVIAVTCSLLATQGCMQYAKWATTVIYVAITKGGKGTCKAIMSAFFGDLPPGLPDICDYVDMAGPLVTKLVSKLEKPIYQRCNQIVLPECIKAAAAGG